MKDSSYEVATKENISSFYWRFKHGFDNVDPKPQDWPIIKVGK